MLDFTDVGCWIIKGNPDTWDYFSARADDDSAPIKPGIYEGGWTVGNTYRTHMMRKGDLFALWITGPRNPGVYEFGRLTSDEPYMSDGFERAHAIDTARAKRATWAIEYAGVRLGDNFVPRAEIKAIKKLAHCEQLRAPQISNPSFFSPTEVKALASLLSARVPKTRMRAAGWGRLI